MFKIQLSLAGLLALAACGGASTSTNPATAAAAERAALSASAAVSAYQNATQTMTTPAECQAAAQQYAADLGAALSQLRECTRDMDHHFLSVGESGAADATCGTDVLADRLRLHLAEACSSGDLSLDRTRAQDHCRDMTQACDRLQMRAAGLCDGTCDGVCDATCDGGMARERLRDGGFTAPDGQLLHWGDPMPGCLYRDGQYEVAPATAPAS